MLMKNILYLLLQVLGLKRLFRSCLRKGEKILDVACGTGLVARIALEKQSSTDLIYGIDVNEVMVKKAQEIQENSDPKRIFHIFWT